MKNEPGEYLDSSACYLQVKSYREGLSGFKEQPDSPKHKRARQSAVARLEGEKGQFSEDLFN